MVLSLDSPFRLCVVPDVRSEGPPLGTPFAPVTGVAPERLGVGVGVGVGVVVVVVVVVGVGVGVGVVVVVVVVLVVVVGLGLAGALANAAVTVSTRSTPFDLATSQITIATPTMAATKSMPNRTADSEPIFLF